MGIDVFPDYILQIRELTLDKASKVGFDSLASARYDFNIKKHIITVANQIVTLQSDYVIFHELTHILDEETYCRGDKIKYLANSGYTEYHASQVGMMKLIGAISIGTPCRFSMSDYIETFSGVKSIREFINAPYSHAVAMLEREDFPADIEALKITIGLLFNYWGRQSICKLYAYDFNDVEDNADLSAFSELFVKVGEDPIAHWKMFLNGWLNKGQVALVDHIYQYEIVSLAKKFDLK